MSLMAKIHWTTVVLMAVSYIAFLVTMKEPNRAAKIVNGITAWLILLGGALEVGMLLVWIWTA